ncbi:MAG TPA: DUF3413 domain-containing protein [candidate division Zixibacteria bacterium]|nr:DUF3413 domain-containing protein [candidate division Zixibacteria bacterium]
MLKQKMNDIKVLISERGYIDRYRYLVMALLLNVPVIYVILMLDVKQADFTLLSWFYISTVILGYYVLPLLIVSSALFMFLFPFRRLLYLVTGAVTVIFVFYLLIDHFVYVIAKIHIDLFWLEWIINDLDAFGLQPSTFRNVLLVLLGIIALEFGIFQIAKKIKKPKYMILIFSVLLILAFAASQIIHVVAYQQNYSRITSLTPYFPIYVPVTSHKNADKFGNLIPISEDDAQAVSGDLNSSLYYPRAELKYSTQSDTALPNLVIIFLESWRIEMMNDTVTPNIFALSQKSSVFTNHFCSGNSTIAGTFGLFYGIHPTYWTAVKANSAIIDNPVLIDHLKEKQYAFGIYARSNFVRHKIKDAIFRGIEVHESFAGKTKIEQDRDMTDRVISFIREQTNRSNPFMAFTFYKSNHFPYEYPPEDSIFMPAEDINLMFADDDTDPVYYRNDYMNSTHYVDALIGDIIRQLDSLGQMEKTIVVITTDHSDELNDNRANYWGHGSNFTKYQSMVPFVLYIPGRKPAQIDYTTSHIDLVPTLMQEVFGCENDIDDYSNGRNLFEKPNGIRPIVVGSYVNHAFVIEDNVYEIYPMYTKKYKLDNIEEKASPPPPDILKKIMDEINHFYKNSDSDQDGITGK